MSMDSLIKQNVQVLRLPLPHNIKELEVLKLTLVKLKYPTVILKPIDRLIKQIEK